IHVQTDLLTEDLAKVERLAVSGIDVLSVHVPAMTTETYAAVMGIDAFQRVLENIAQFARARHAHGRSVPLMVPVFTKTQQNLAVIMARAGSAGLKDKHLLPLHGRPVIEYTFDHARAAKCIGRVVVSSDCAKMRQLAERNWFETIARPTGLATAEALVQDVLL